MLESACLLTGSLSMASPPAVTRFPPSPTGYLHIGSARTALFNWLFARHTGGKFLLRIEDTDRARSTPEAVEAIFEGMKWLGLDWDNEPVFQSSRAERHRAEALRLLAEGKAYYCYASQEEVQALRELARAQGRALRSPWRERAASEAPPGIKPVLRLKAPLTGETVVRDAVQGDVRFQNEQLDDMVILRADGSPLYHLAVVVDDEDMGVTYVIRGDDHLTNAGRQLQLIRALGYREPIYGHIPMILGPDAAKLSKRHGALYVGVYRDMGYLPEALRNYLARLGWGHGDDEIFSTEQAIAWFTLEAINRAPARIDFAKLNNLNGHYIRMRDDASLTALTIDMLTRVKECTLPPGFENQLLAAMPSMKERAKTIAELADACSFMLVKRPLAPDEKAAKLLTADVRRLLADAKTPLAALSDWSASAIEAAVRAFAEARGLKLGGIAQPLRAAITGSSVSPPIFEVMAIIGRDEALARLCDQTDGPAAG
jgi:glutamyl-tRNA synthetase